MYIDMSTTLSYKQAMQVLKWCNLWTGRDVEYIQLAYEELDQRYEPYSEQWMQARLILQDVEEQLTCK